MKLTITTCIEENPARSTVEIKFQSPSVAHPRSLMLLAGDLTPTRYPHLVPDLSRVAAFWGDRLTLHQSDISLYAKDGQFNTTADVIHCPTDRLLAICRTLLERRVKHAEVETTRLSTVLTIPQLTISQIAHHENMRGADRLGRTLRYFRVGLAGAEPADGHRRTFADLLRDVSHYVQRAVLHAHGDEFYFDGRRPGGCGFNGGIILHRGSYGIHT